MFVNASKLRKSHRCNKWARVARVLATLSPRQYRMFVFAGVCCHSVLADTSQFWLISVSRGYSFAARRFCLDGDGVGER